MVQRHEKSYLESKMNPKRTNIRGFYGIGVYNPKRECNFNTIYRTAFNMGADFVFQLCTRYKNTAADTCKSFRHIPCWYFDDIDQLIHSQPKESILIGVEQYYKSVKLNNHYLHPERAIYLLGSEDVGLPYTLLDKCHHVIEIPSVTKESMNVATAGGIIMYHRQLQRGNI